MATTTTITRPATGTEEETGLWSWLTTVDHKRIGKLYFVSSGIFFLIAGIEALMIRVQLAVPNAGFVSSQTYNELFTMHATTMIFLALMPMSAAFFNFLIPLQIGARDVVFPRMNAFSYWLWLFGAIFLHTSFLSGTLPDGGWFGYAPMTSARYSPGPSIDYWMLGLLIVGTSSMVAGINFITTIFNLRAPGMTLFRMPLFTWMSLVTQFLLVLSLPMVTIGLVLLLFDRNYGTTFYMAEGGGDPLLWQHLFWLFGHPEVYILILPAFGMISEVIPTFSRKPLFGAPFVIFSGIMIGFIGFGVWSHHMFTTGLGPIADAAFSVATSIIAVPTAVKIFNWIATMWGGKLRLTTSMMYAVGFVFLFTIGGLSGVMHASPPVDLHQQDSYIVVAHFHYVLFGGSVMGLFAGTYYYFPKMFGRMLDETLGKIGFWLVFLGMNGTFFPMHFVGAMGMPRRIFTYPEDVGWSFWNLFMTISAFVLATGILINVINMVRSRRRGALAPPDPWDASTLEWTMASPPPHYNFARVPVVHSDRPLWAEKHEGGPPVSQAVLATEGLRHPTMPNGSYWPILTALALALFMIAFMAGKGGNQFKADAFARQVALQIPIALAFLFCAYRWILEDLFAGHHGSHTEHA